MFDKVNLQQFFNSFLSTPAPNQPPPGLEVTCSHDFLDWLKMQHISLGFTTYQSSRLMLLGVNEQDQLSGFERFFDFITSIIV